MLAVNMLKLWARPAIIASLWIIAAAFMLSELATVAPLLRSSRAEPPQAREPKQPPLGARRHATNRPAAFAP
jgi:hypothetical protein